MASHTDPSSLFTKHHAWLQSWLVRKMGNSFDAADLAQDVFMRVLTRQHTQQLGEPRAYLSTIAKNLMVDHWRRRALEKAWLETLAAMPEAETPAPEQRLMFLETLIEIDRVLDAMKPPVRKAFLLAQLDGYTCPQIAKELQVSLATAERYISKALKQCYNLRFES